MGARRPNRISPEAVMKLPMLHWAMKGKNRNSANWLKRNQSKRPLAMKKARLADRANWYTKGRVDGNWGPINQYSSSHTPEATHTRPVANTSRTLESRVASLSPGSTPAACKRWRKVGVGESGRVMVGGGVHAGAALRRARSVPRRGGCGQAPRSGKAEAARPSAGGGIRPSDALAEQALGRRAVRRQRFSDFQRHRFSGLGGDAGLVRGLTGRRLPGIRRPAIDPDGDTAVGMTHDAVETQRRRLLQAGTVSPEAAQFVQLAALLGRVKESAQVILGAGCAGQQVARGQDKEHGRQLGPRAPRPALAGEVEGGHGVCRPGSTVIQSTSHSAARPLPPVSERATRHHMGRTMALGSARRSSSSRSRSSSWTSSARSRMVLVARR